MVRKSYTPEQILNKLREAEILLKEWLYRKRTEVRLARERSERWQEREAQAVRRKAEHPVLFEF